MGGVFRIDRVINNNVISVLEDGHEVILTGRGLGFGQHAGGTYEPARVERRFVLDDSRSAAGFTAMIAELPYEVIVLSNQIADYVEQEFGVWLSSARQLALADHIQFAIERLAKGQRLANELLWELKNTYRTEFGAALQILDMVTEATGVVLPVDEAGFVTMHLVNAGLPGQARGSLSTAAAVSDIVTLVREELGIPLATDSVAYARFLTHVKFAVQRIEEGQLLANPDNALFEMVSAQDPTSYQCAQVIARYVLGRYEVVLPEEELLYLMVHVNRLRSRDSTTA